MTKALDPEIKALRRLGRALDAVRELDDPKAQRRVYQWVGERAFWDRSRSWDAPNTGSKPDPRFRRR